MSNVVISTATVAATLSNRIVQFKPLQYYQAYSSYLLQSKSILYSLFSICYSELQHQRSSSLHETLNNHYLARSAKNNRSNQSPALPLHFPSFEQVKMSAGHNDPRILFSVNNITAYHIQDGEESPLSVSGPQTLSLLMVPTSSPFADLSSTEPQSAAPEEDFYLHLHLPPELDLALPATTQIYHQPPRSYLIPRWDLGPDSGAFTRIEFPKIGTGSDRVTQEDIDTFETILAQCTAFLERASPPNGKGHDAYNPATFAPGEGYIGQGHTKSKPGQIILVDEENGSVVGELSEGFDVVEGAGVTPGSKSDLSTLWLVTSANIVCRPCRDSITTRRRG